MDFFEEMFFESNFEFLNFGHESTLTSYLSQTLFQVPHPQTDGNPENPYDAVDLSSLSASALKPETLPILKLSRYLFSISLTNGKKLDEGRQSSSRMMASSTREKTQLSPL